jgi:hypothetical protein
MSITIADFPQDILLELGKQLDVPISTLSLVVFNTERKLVVGQRNTIILKIGRDPEVMDNSLEQATIRGPSPRGWSDIWMS